MIAQSEYTSNNNNNYSGYGSISGYQSGNASNTLGGAIGIASSMNPYGSPVIGSSNGYSNVLSISSGGITSVASCYPLPSTAQHLQQTDKNCSKDR